MFKIFVKDLILYGYHGVLDKEKLEGQNFLFNIEISITGDFLVGGDKLKNTVNYSEVIEIVKKVSNENKFDLLETLALKIAENLLAAFELIRKVKIRIEKTNPPIKEQLSSVGVSINLKRKDDFLVKSELEKDYLLKYEVKKINNSDLKAAYLSIGTNLGDRLQNINTALEKIMLTKAFNLVKVSSIYETSPMYLKEQDDFYNIVLKALVSKNMSAFVLLGCLKQIEYEMGRGKSYLINGPRIIDIDILSIEGENIDSEILSIPHKKMHERNFVLIPLSEIEPSYILDGKKIAEYLAAKNFKDKAVKQTRGKQTRGQGLV